MRLARRMMVLMFAFSTGLLIFSQSLWAQPGKKEGKPAQIKLPAAVAQAVKEGKKEAK